MNNKYLIIVGAIFLVLAAVAIVAVAGCRGRQHESFDPCSDHGLAESLEIATVGDHKTVVRKQIGCSGKTIVLLHNSPMTHEIWNGLFRTMQMWNLNKQHTPTLIAYDLRGHGAAWQPVNAKFTDANPQNFAWPLSLYVADCMQILATVSEPITLVGFGFGGLVAQTVALAYPERISKLVLLQTSIRPIPELAGEIGALSEWIQSHPGVDYLTPREADVHTMLCDWFNLPASVGCSGSGGTDNLIPEYNIAASNYRQGSCTTLLQTDKLILSTDLVTSWANLGKAGFSIHLLTAKNDPLASPARMTETYTSIYNQNRELLVVMDIVDGRHGFTIVHPEYIGKILL